MKFLVSVWNSGMYDETTNRLRQNSFVEKVKKIKNCFVKENHMDAALVVADDDSKIKEIIKSDFDGNGFSMIRG